MTKIAMIGVGKLGKECAEVMAMKHSVAGYDLEPRTTSFPMVSNIRSAIFDREIIFIAAPTAHDPEYGGESPTSHLPNKDFDYSVVIEILAEINKHATKNQLVVLISTVLPGTVRKLLAPCITNAKFIYNPYLIAMGTIKWDMVNPEMIIIGTEDGSTTNDAKTLIEFYQTFMENNPRYEIGTWDEAESIKIFYNTFISTKIALVNMIQDVAETNGNINVDVVTNALAKSSHRITGPAYMTAGMGDGGACHPRDNIALRYLAERLDLEYDLFDAIMKAREIQARRLAKRCLANGNNITIIGKAYKPGVPYINGSPSMLVGHYIEQLGGKVRYFDLNTGDGDLFQNWTEVYLIGYWEKWVENIKFPMHVTVIDPWRKIKPEAHSCGIIHYGNSRNDLFVYNKNKIQVDSFSYSIKRISKIWPEIGQNINQYYILPATPASVSSPVEIVVSMIKKEIANGKTKVIFDGSGEGTITYVIKYVQTIISLIPELTTGNIFFVTAALNAESVYTRLADSRNWKKRLIILSRSTFDDLMRINVAPLLATVQTIDYDIRVKPKKFLCFNRLARGHRIVLLAKMIKKNLFSDAFYSFEAASPDWLVKLHMKEGLSTEEMEFREIIFANKNMFPLRLNITENRNNPIDLIPEDLAYHQNSYFSLVTETSFNSFEFMKERNLLTFTQYLGESAMFLTEKTFRPIALKHPFLIVGLVHSLKAIRQLGYKTFHPFINESYDDQNDESARLDMIVSEVERLSNFSDEEWLVWQTNVKPIVEYNFQLLIGKTDQDYAITKFPSES